MSEESFDAGWLALREPIDHRSRAGALIPRLKTWWVEEGCSRVLDLGSGTGSNLRYLAPLLPGKQRWTLLDHDPALLARVQAPAPHVQVRTVQADIDGPGLGEVGGAHLVTASALLDLVSEAWLSSLAAACSERGCGALFALTYDGTIEWVSPEGSQTATEGVDDTLVREAVNAHQLRNKGLGPALGPTAGRVAERLFESHGFRSWLLPSPWRLGSSDAQLASALVAGWAAAAVEERPDSRATIEEWAVRRETSITEGDFALTVGHWDLLALPEPQASDSS